MKYTKEQFLKAAELGEVSMIDAKHIISLLDEVVELPQQEISDEEIEKAAANLANPNADKTDNWIEGSKWYREQLKCKGNGES
jgi:hypothetical protein